MQWMSVIVWLLFLAISIVSAVTLWVSEHPFRIHGFGVLVLLAPTFLGIYLYRHAEYAWLLTTSVAGIIIQLFVVRKLAEVDS